MACPKFLTCQCMLGSWGMCNLNKIINVYDLFFFFLPSCLGRDHMVVGFITTYAISTYNH
jgi:hypothetical protein